MADRTIASVCDASRGTAIDGCNAASAGRNEDGPSCNASVDFPGLQDLPPPDTKRWVMRRKAEVVEAVRCGLISLEEACQRYTLSEEEFLSWQRLIDSHGVRGLRATRLQEYRGGSGGESSDASADD
ncbi:MAG: DUF1153 domain-containing protein [Rhodospirillaceae bacterium]